MDISMPEMRGSRPQHYKAGDSEAKVVIASALARRPRQESIALGAKHFIVNPSNRKRPPRLSGSSWKREVNDEV
jgi:hypothetical protein